MEVKSQIQTPAALPRENRPPQYPLDKRLDGHQGRSGRCGVKKFTPAGNWTPAILALFIHYADWAIPALI
jgi:hypothetical protein